MACCCFGYSSTEKGGSNKKSKSVEAAAAPGWDDDDMINDQTWAKKDGMLSDLSTFSVKEQKRQLKRAKEEEEKASREAERVVQWVKQESARMDASSIKHVVDHSMDDDLKP